MRFTLSLMALALAACGGGGEAPAPTPTSTPAFTVASGGTGTVTATPVVQAPAPAIAASAPVPMCGPNQVGAMFPCDPRWPFPGKVPADGATQSQVDGFNHDNCTSVACLLERCTDGRVVSYIYRAACNFAPPPKT